MGKTENGCPLRNKGCCGFVKSKNQEPAESFISTSVAHADRFQATVLGVSYIIYLRYAAK